MSTRGRIVGRDDIRIRRPSFPLLLLPDLVLVRFQLSGKASFNSKAMTALRVVSGVERQRFV